jgi:hypothetical protein
MAKTPKSSFVQPDPVDPVGVDNLPPDAQVLYDTVRNNGARLYHHKGYYTYIIHSSFVDDLGVTWVLYFNADNCGTKFHKYDGSIMRQFSDPNFNKEDVVKESFYHQNQLCVASFERLCERNEEGSLKLLISPPAEDRIKPLTIRHVGAVQANRVEETPSEATFRMLMSNPPKHITHPTPDGEPASQK